MGKARKKLRKCKGVHWMCGKCITFELGYFHKWGTGFDTLEQGLVSFTNAIVELPDGRIITTDPENIVFLDK